MDAFWTQLEQWLQTGPLRRRVMVTPSRSMGRRLLMQYARRGHTVVGVEAHSMFTLAMDLCSGAMAGGDGLRFLSRLETEELVARLLGDSDLVQRHPALGSLGGAKAVWRLLEELELYGIPMEPREGQDLWNGLTAFGQRLRQTLAERNLLTRPGLYRLALETVEQGKEMLPVRDYALLSSAELTPLERQLWQALTGGAGTVLTVDILEGDALREHLRDRCRFVRSRGRENEIRLLLDEVLHSGKPLDRAAVAVTNADYALRLWREGQRLGVPVAVDGGIPLRCSTLYGLLQGLLDWQESDYEAELLIPLLRHTGLSVPHPTTLQRELRQCKVGWQQDRYALVWQERADDAENMRERRGQWKNFFDRLFRAVAVSPEQKTALGILLRDGCQVQSAESAAASWQLRSILEQLEPREGLSMVRQLLEAVGDSRYLSGGPTDGVLSCCSLEQSLSAEAETLYVLGLEQYSLERGEVVSPLLGREERAALGLPEQQAASPLEQLQRLLSLWQGNVVLLRPTFTAAEMREQPAAPFYEELLELCGAAEEVVDYTLSPDDAPADAPAAEQAADKAEPPAAANQTDERFPDGKTWVERYAFSATSLETALQCPYRFYLEHVLRIRQPKEVSRPQGRWLEAGPFGTLVHDVLEHYFAARMEGRAADAEELLRQQAARLRETEPPAPSAWVERDLERARLYIRRAIGQFDPNRTVAGTEYAFGKGCGGDDLVIPVGKYRIHIEGRIDRVDRLGPDTYAIVDYKTGQSRKYREHPQWYLQPLLYTLAAEQLLGETAHVAEAGYLFLGDDGDNALVFPQTPQTRADGLAKLEALLDLLCRFDCEPERNPCFAWDGQTLLPGDEKQREKHDTCGKYCPYRPLCEQ